MANPRVLIAVPYHTKKAYCKAHLDKCLESLSYPNKEIIIRYDPLEYGSQDAAKKQREFFREVALAGGFHYLYFLGADTIPPDDVIERLLHKAEPNNIKIIGGVYWGRSNAENGDPAKAVAWIHDEPQEEQTRLFSQANCLLAVDGMGMDCVLIHREALAMTSFLSWPQNDDDYPFYDKSREVGYQAFIDTSIQAKHFFSETGYSQRGKVYSL